MTLRGGCSGTSFGKATGVAPERETCVFETDSVGGAFFVVQPAGAG